MVTNLMSVRQLTWNKQNILALKLFPGLNYQRNMKGQYKESESVNSIIHSFIYTIQKIYFYFESGEA